MRPNACSSAPFLYAIGDVHGRDGLLERLHARIIHDPYRPADTGKPIVVHLGDYIDGGSQGGAVIDRVMKGAADFDTVALLGNHETLMLACLDTDERDVWWNWLSNGGERTLEGLGISLRTRGYDPRALSDALGPARIGWLRARPLHYRAGDYLFVHAGIAPGVPLEEQQAKDLLWIRGRFLDSDADHGCVVIHGHTQTVAPEVRANRIGIDTGEARPKTLTAVALASGAPPRFLNVSEDS
jgi:serine/threonine protein phosphatase 1